MIHLHLKRKILFLLLPWQIRSSDYIPLWNETQFWFLWVGKGQQTEALMYLAGSYAEFVGGTFRLSSRYLKQYNFSCFHKPQSTEEMLEFKSGKSEETFFHSNGLMPNCAPKNRVLQWFCGKCHKDINTW